MNKDFLKEVESYDVVGITSIFTAQTRMVEKVVTSIRQNYPDKLIILGGVNARHQMQRFFNAGTDLICLSEAEETIVEIGDILRSGKKDFSIFLMEPHKWDIVSSLDDNPCT